MQRLCDLPTVRDLIKKSDEEALIYHLESIQEQNGIEPCAEETLATFKDEMSHIKLDENGDTIIVPQQYLEENYCDPRMTCIVTQAEAYNINRLRCLREPFTTRNCIAYATIDWAEVLTYRVWWPESFSQAEVYELISDIIFEMTTFGVTYEDAKKNYEAFCEDERRPYRDSLGFEEWQKEIDKEMEPWMQVFGGHDSYQKLHSNMSACKIHLEDYLCEKNDQYLYQAAKMLNA